MPEEAIEGMPTVYITKLLCFLRKCNSVHMNTCKDVCAILQQRLQYCVVLALLVGNKHVSYIVMLCASLIPIVY